MKFRKELIFALGVETLRAMPLPPMTYLYGITLFEHPKQSFNLFCYATDGEAEAAAGVPVRVVPIEVQVAGETLNIEKRLNLDL